MSWGEGPGLEENGVTLVEILRTLMLPSDLKSSRGAWGTPPEIGLAAWSTSWTDIMQEINDFIKLKTIQSLMFF